MTKTKKWILIGTGIVVIIGIALFWFSRGDENENLQKETVESGSLKKTVSITGSLISESPINLNFENLGRLQEIKVKVGDEVAEGDLIAVLENNILNEQVKKAKANLERVKMEAGTSSDTTREILKKVENAEDYLDAVEDYHDQVVDAAEVSYQNASDYADDVEDYYNQIVSNSGVGSTEAKSAKITLTSAQNAEKSAEEALETARKNRELSLISAENALDTVEESLKTVKSDYSQGSRSALVEAAEVDYQIALKNLNNSSLKAPLNGVISKINYEKGEVIGSASVGGAFGEMITKDFVLEADIPEANISEIEVGQTAEVIFDAFNFEDKFEAEVIEIDPASTEIQGVIYYKAKLKIENSSFQFKEGMSADIDILIDTEENAIKVLDQFIFSENGQDFVYVQKDGKLIERTVEVGLDGDDGYTEILSGLKEGENVYFESR